MQYKAENDWLSNFLDECCKYGANEAESGSALYAAYSDWCVRMGEYKRCNRDFAHAMEARGMIRRKGSRGNSWLGVAVIRE